MMPLAEIKIKTDGGPWADHNMPCAVCRVQAAVLDLHTGHFEPCWKCQEQGWQLKKTSRFWSRSPFADPPTEEVEKGLNPFKKERRFDNL